MRPMIEALSIVRVNEQTVVQTGRSLISFTIIEMTDVEKFHQAVENGNVEFVKQCIANDKDMLRKPFGEGFDCRWILLGRFFCIAW